MYVSEMKHFAAVVAGQAEPLVTLADGIEVLKIVKTARISQI